VIRIRLSRDTAGIIRSCRVEGHAEAGPKGMDIVCAAVSVLLRTALKTLSNRQGIRLRGSAPERGLLWMETDYTAQGRDFLDAAGAFLTEGLCSVAEEFPDYCSITIVEE
jgi:uncharacterized protein YsxB (DUF464 family)